MPFVSDTALRPSPRAFVALFPAVLDSPPMDSKVQAWSQGDFVLGCERFHEFSTTEARYGSPKHCKRLHTFHSMSTSRSCFGAEQCLGNAYVGSASARVGVGMRRRIKSLSYSTMGGKTCYCNTHRSSRGTMSAWSKFWGSFADKDSEDSEVPQSESNSAVTLGVSIRDSVLACNSGECDPAADEMVMLPEKASFDLTGVSERGTDHTAYSDRLEFKGRNDSTSASVGTTRSEMRVGGTAEFLSNHPVSDNLLKEESSPPSGSPDSSPLKTSGFSWEKSSSPNSVQEGTNLSSMESDQWKMLMSFRMTSYSSKGILVIRALRVEQLSEVEQLLTDSYAELMWGPFAYRPVLAWILRGYLRERQTSLPNAVTLVGLHAPSEENELAAHSTQCKWYLVGAVEVSFNASGQPEAMLTPFPPKDAPFLSNMAVQKKYRRRGIGRQLLKAAEQLAVEMGCKEMYLHCRMVDDAPLSLYLRSGYEIVATDSILSLLSFQRRRHLLRKRLPEFSVDEKSEDMEDIPQSFEDM